MGGRGGNSGIKHEAAKTPLYETDKNGVRKYRDTEESMREFMSISDNYVSMNKAAYVDKPGELPVTVKKTQLWEYLKEHGINDFRVIMDKGSETRTLKQLDDYGYHVVAKSARNDQATQKFHMVEYVVGKKEMSYLGLDLKMKKYYKRGWKG